jgi:hypothetical protein
MKWLTGKKTIIGSVATGAIIIVSSLNLLDEQVVKVLLGLVVAWTGVSLRLAVKQ